MNDRARNTAALLAARRLSMAEQRERGGRFRAGQSGNPGGRRRGVVPRAVPPTMIENEYTRAVLELVMPRLRAAFAPLLESLPSILAAAQRERAHRGDASVVYLPTLDVYAWRADAGESKRARELIERARASIAESIKPAAVEALAEKFAVRTSTHQRIQLHKQTTAALGANVFVSDRWLRPLIEAYNEANVSLIRGMTDQLSSDIEKSTMRAIQDGTLHPDLARELQERFGYAEDRAKLIARDQVGKLYGQIAAARQRELGVTHFIWRSVGDDRVRDEHEERDGETYAYDDPPDGELPGEPILCRCYPEPVFDTIFAALDE